MSFPYDRFVQLAYAQLVAIELMKQAANGTRAGSNSATQAFAVVPNHKEIATAMQLTPTTYASLVDRNNINAVCRNDPDLRQWFMDLFTQLNKAVTQRETSVIEQHQGHKKAGRL